MRGKVESGYTQEMMNEKVSNWYYPPQKGGKKAQAQQESLRDWDELMSTRTTYEVLQKLRPVPFYRYLVRYLVYSHVTELKETEAGRLLQADPETWEEAFIAEICREIRDGEKQTVYTDSLVSQIVDDFTARGYERQKPEKKEPKKKTKKAAEAEKRYVCGDLEDTSVWSEEDVKKVICGSSISDANFFLLAIGLNMAYDDVLLFLRKVLMRGGFNFWNLDEMLLYLAIRYASGNRLKFYREAKEAYGKLEAKAGITVDASFGTHTIESRIQAMIRQMESSLSALDGVTPETEQFLSEYKYLVQNSESYRRTAVRQFQRLRSQFEKNCASDMHIEIEARFGAGGFLDERNTENRYSAGELEVFYQPGKPICIPKGTVFAKKEKKDGQDRTVRFESTAEVYVEATEWIDVVIPVELTAAAKDEDGSQEKQTVFACGAGISGLGEVRNKSKFKQNKGKTIQGKLFGSCKAGTVIPAGTIFEANGSQYACQETIKTAASVIVPIQCLSELEEALKNEITEIESSFKTKENIIGLAHSKIKLKKSTGEKLGQLCAYLYAPSEGNNYYIPKNDKGMEIGRKPEEYAKLLQPILKGTKLTDSRLSNIKNRADVVITRTEILTMAFLAVMSERQFDVSWEEEVDTRMKLREFLGENLQMVNECLISCGFYGVYLPNPYDTLLAYLTICDEPVTAFRNLWGILSKYEQDQKKKEEE